MLFRRKIWPKTLSDFASMTFVLVIVPLLYWFELWIVLPDLYEYGSPAYFCHFALGNFIMINIVGNFTFAVLRDTSIRNVGYSTKRGKPEEGWRFCGSCECLTPPRSWHCRDCGVCILKRDHHCIFTGCCVGHFNHRYFLMFLFYLFAGTLYAFTYNNFFIWSKIEFQFPMSLVKIVFPLAIFAFGFDPSLEQFYLMLYIVNAVGMCFTGFLGYYHADLALRGCVADEKAKGIRKYNLGWRNNVREIFGEKWYLTWILPYIRSELSHDGVRWATSGSEQDDSRKIR